jgi:hypothetical protein
VLLKHESTSGIVYRSRADEEAAASATPGTEISCARAPSSERQPVLLKHESKSGIVYRSRADEAAVASITPGMEISCA